MLSPVDVGRRHQLNASNSPVWGLSLKEFLQGTLMANQDHALPLQIRPVLHKVHIEPRPMDVVFNLSPQQRLSERRVGWNSSMQISLKHQKPPKYQYTA